ncbi:Dyp-type peroxidase family [Motilibacter peucedani]|uniref:Dyp-type peroxidase family n=1 Tax=Motilibacter peucedani TaxID=598650 RepID=A0A420XU23_9ACTN|nr:Dyp-type peroxidase [Motilibacter peucedani]RKS80328.1 Dyp-type peroxidase family [Motilibacter peucedani]
MAGTALSRRGRLAIERVDEDDVQALVFQGYGKLRGACYLVLEVVDPARARGWLASLVPRVSAGSGRPDGRAVNVAVTHEGLRRLGLAEASLAEFPVEVQEGMTSPHRSRLLGDVGAAAPAGWEWGGPGSPSPDLLLLLYAPDDEQVARLRDEEAARAEASGLRLVRALDTHDLGPVEHFGFRDGVSQPAIAGFGRPGPAMHTVRAGEFVLGYRNEHDQVPPTPTVDAATDRLDVLPETAGGRRDLGRDGSYLVVRQLEQDVHAFWRFLDQCTRRADGSSDGAARTRLAARMVGRWPGGAPVTQSPEHDDPALAESNEFGYAADLAGHVCPVGAHVRRTNPRDSLPPKPGTDASVAVGKRHRLMRRGREYGPPVDLAGVLAGGELPRWDDEAGDVRGLHFLCLCADVARQFEFVTHTWALNAQFDGLYDDADPLLGGHLPTGHSFTEQAVPVRRRTRGLPAFVTVRGGAYFFLPGVRALRYLAALGG